MLLLGILAGWSNENICVALVAGCIAAMIYTKKKQGKIGSGQISGFIGLLTGSALLLLAPGNYVRLDAHIEEKAYGLFKTILVRCYYIERAVFTYLFPVLFCLVCVSLAAYWIYRIKVNFTEILFIGMGIVSVGSMLASPQYPSRATFGSMILFIIPTVSLLQRMLEEGGTIKKIVLPAIGFAYFAFVCQMLTMILHTMLR